MPNSADNSANLATLLSIANDDEAHIIRDLATRAGLLQHCRCGYYNPADAEQCEDCTRSMPELTPSTAPALGLVAIRDYLGNVHVSGDVRFIEVCRGGLCGSLAAEVALDLAPDTATTHESWWVIAADDIIAGVEDRALASGAPQIATTA